MIASALSVISAAQIPTQAKWEITFAQVEASIGLSELRSAPPEAFEVRVMQRPWSAFAPLPFLRLARKDGAVEAQLFMFWAAKYIPPGRGPSGPDVSCRDGVCVKPVEMTERRDWDAVARLAFEDACPADRDGRVGGCADCDHVWIKTMAGGRYQEQSCNSPRPDTPAAALLQLLRRAAEAFKY